MQTTYTLGARTFVLDKAKAEAALAAKRVVGGRETSTFNLLPLRYGWAYELYRTMKANHWEPEDVPMQRDLEQWRAAGMSRVMLQMLDMDDAEAMDLIAREVVPAFR